MVSSPCKTSDLLDFSFMMGLSLKFSNSYLEPTTLNLGKTNWYACHTFGLILSRYEKMENSSTISFPFYGNFLRTLFGSFSVPIRTSVPESNIFHVRSLFRFLNWPQGFCSRDHLEASKVLNSGHEWFRLNP